MNVSVLLDTLNERGNISTLFEYLPEVDRYDIDVTALPPKGYPRLEADIGRIYWSKKFECYCFYAEVSLRYTSIGILPEEVRDILLLLDFMNKNAGKLLTLEENE